ncbi:MAG TPA: glycosyltransferase, partial [Vicinamibacterales bacterium]|nr:glycosyltransferase [Vicinamibacterales bacterium]
AEVLARAGAADVIEQKDLTGGTLADRILRLVADESARRQMAQAAAAFTRPDAARVIVDRALALVG